MRPAQIFPKSKNAIIKYSDNPSASKYPNVRKYKDSNHNYNNSKSVINGVSSLSQLKQNLECLNLSISKELMDEINQIHIAISKCRHKKIIAMDLKTVL